MPCHERALEWSSTNCSPMRPCAADLRVTRWRPSPAVSARFRSHARRDRSLVPDRCGGVVPEKRRERRTPALRIAHRGERKRTAMSIDLGSCAVRETIVVNTRASVYELIVLRGDEGDVLVRGGSHFTEFRRVLFVGSTADGGCSTHGRRHRSSHAVHLWIGSSPSQRSSHSPGVPPAPLRRSVQPARNPGVPRGSGAHACSQRVVRTARVHGDAPQYSPVPLTPPSFAPSPVSSTTTASCENARTVCHDAPPATGR